MADLRNLASASPLSHLRYRATAGAERIRRGGCVGARESFPRGSVGTGRAPPSLQGCCGISGKRDARLTRSQDRVRPLGLLSSLIIHASPLPLEHVKTESVRIDAEAAFMKSVASRSHPDRQSNRWDPETWRPFPETLILLRTIQHAKNGF